MMRIDGVGNRPAPAASGGSDSISRNLQNQIAGAQKQLQELSKNQELTPEEKMKKRQELTQQITELNNQLKQHEVELRREQQAAAAENMPDHASKAEQSQTAAVEISQKGMEALLSADSSLKLAEVQNSVKKRMEGRAGVLEQEIKLDAGRSSDTADRQEALSKLEQRISAVDSMQMKTLGEAAQALVRPDSGVQDRKEKGDLASQEKENVNADEEQDILKDPEENEEIRKGMLEKAGYTPSDVRKIEVLI